MFPSTSPPGMMVSSTSPPFPLALATRVPPTPSIFNPIPMYFISQTSPVSFLYSAPSTFAPYFPHIIFLIVCIIFFLLFFTIFLWQLPNFFWLLNIQSSLIIPTILSTTKNINPSSFLLSSPSYHSSCGPCPRLPPRTKIEQWFEDFWNILIQKKFKRCFFSTKTSTQSKQKTTILHSQNKCKVCWKKMLYPVVV